jgi:hypothetical protein
MAFLDSLKKLLPKHEPMPWDAQTIGHPHFRLRLPEGWRFTRADWDRAAAVGPADHGVELFYSVRQQRKLTPEEMPKVLELMRMLVRHDARLKTAPTQATLPNGVLWTEASEVKGVEQQFVVYVLNIQETRATQICLRTSVPVASGNLGAERLETLRGALRAVQYS